MSYTEQQLRDLLNEADGMPYGAAKTAAIEQVIAHADAGRMTRLSFHARMMCTNAYVYGGEPAKSVVTFSWCLAEYDSNPNAYGGWRHTLLWHFKYMVVAMLKVPEVSLARTYSVLDEMQRRWQDAGSGLNAVYHYRHQVAEHVGDLPAAQEWFDKWRITPRDQLSDCIGCTPSGQARWLHQTGRDEEAVRLAEPLLAGPPTCSEQPQNLLTTLLVPYLRTGRLEQARDAHRRGYLLVRPNLSDLADIGDHVQFCARTGNGARAVEIVERHLPWLDRAPSPYAAMYFAASAALALRLAGAPEVTLHRPAHGDRPASDVPAAELATSLAQEALAVAARFDARNGTSRQSDLIHEILDAQPLVDHLPLSPTARRPEQHPPSAPVASAPRRPAEAEAPPRSAEAEAPQPPAVPASAGPDELLDLAESWHRAERIEEAFAAWHAFDERYATGPLTVLQRARRADGNASECATAGDLDAARVSWSSAVELYAEAGDETRRQEATGRLGMTLCDTGDAARGLSMVEDSTAYLVGHGSAAQRISALLRLVAALASAGQTQRAESVLDDIEAQPPQATAVVPHLPTKVLLRRAHLAGQAGNPQAVRSFSERARELSRQAGDRNGLAGACWLVGLSAEQLGDPAAALDAYDEALTAVRNDKFRAAIRTQRAGLLAGSSRAAEAVADLVEAVAQATADGAGEQAARARHKLAIGYLNTGRPLDAAEVAEEALAWFDRAGDPHGTEVRHLLAAAYRRLNQPNQAISQLEAISAECARHGNQAGVGQMAEETGEILDSVDRDAAAATAFLAAAQAYHEAGLALDEARAYRRHATSLHWSHNAEGALAALATADALAAILAAGDQATAWERALLAYDGGRILGNTERLDEALGRTTAAVAAFRNMQAPVQIAHAEALCGELLLRSDRPREAEQAARRALTSLPERAGGRERMADLLAATLDAQDRPAEASKVRQEYGIADG